VENKDWVETTQIHNDEWGCKCRCCIYWRRHIHRVGANKDRIISKKLKDIKHWKEKSNTWNWLCEKANQELLSSQATTRLVRRQLKELKAKMSKKKTMSIFSWPFG